MTLDSGRSAADTRCDVDALRVKLASVRARAGLAVIEALNDIPCAVLAVDDAGRYIGANAAASELTGYSLDELLKKSVADLTPSEDAAIEERLWNAFTRTRRQNGEYEIQRGDATVVRVVYDAFFDVAPGIHVSFVKRASPSTPYEGRETGAGMSRRR